MSPRLSDSWRNETYPASLSRDKALSGECPRHSALHPSSSCDAAATGRLANGQVPSSLRVEARGFPLLLLEPRLPETHCSKRLVGCAERLLGWRGNIKRDALEYYFQFVKFLVHFSDFVQNIYNVLFHTLDDSSIINPCAYFLTTTYWHWTFLTTKTKLLKSSRYPGLSGTRYRSCGKYLSAQ